MLVKTLIKITCFKVRVFFTLVHIRAVIAVGPGSNRQRLPVAQMWPNSSEKQLNLGLGSEIGPTTLLSTETSLAIIKFVR